MPFLIAPVPPEPPETKPPSVDCAVDGYIGSCWPVLAAACSSAIIVAPASAIRYPSPTSMMARAFEVSSTRPPDIGMPWP